SWTGRCASSGWPKISGRGYPPSGRRAGPTACSSFPRARWRGPARKPVTNSSRRDRPPGDGPRPRGPRRPARTALRRVRRARQLVLLRLPRSVRARGARRPARSASGRSARRAASGRGAPAQVRRGARPRRGARRAAEGRGCRGEGRRRPGGARLRRGGRGMTRSRWLVRGLLLFVLAFANLNDIRPEQTAGGEAPGLWSPDVLPNALFAWTLIKEHNVDYDEFVFPPTGGASKPAPGAVQAAKEKIDREAYFFRACGVSTA